MKDIINVVVSVNGIRHQMSKEDFKKWPLNEECDQ